MNGTSQWRRLLQRGHKPQRRPGCRPHVEELESRCLLSVTGFRPIDEVGNNLADPNLGTAGTNLLRISTAAYRPAPNGDGLNSPSLPYGDPSFIAGPRLVSNVVSNQATTLFGATDYDIFSENALSDFAYTWGQFIDHDMDLTPTLSGKITSASWSAGVVTITVADGLFRVGDQIIVKGMTPAGFNTSPVAPLAVVLSATPNNDGSTTLTYALATDPGPATTLGKVANNTTKDGANGFPIPKDPLHDGVATPGVPQPEVVDPIGLDAENTLAFTRSVYDISTGITTPREQINVSTSYLDLSQVYGSTNVVADALRTHSRGLLKTSPGADGIIGTKDDLLPYNNSDYFTAAEIAAFGMANDVHLVADTELFVAGDPRANETIELTSLQTLWVRNHNRLAHQLRALHPFWGDELLYQEARKINIGQYQVITYTQYLPAILGPGALPAYAGYNQTVDPSIATEFSTLAFRFGHSQLNNDVHRDNNDGTGVMNGSTPDGPVPLALTFFNPRLLAPGGVQVQVGPNTFHISTDIGAVLKGDADHAAQATDVYAVSAIRNLLFGQGGQGEDLIARDMWRVDDHGIGTYNHLREAYDLDPITDTTLDLVDPTDGTHFVSHGFEQITSDLHVARLLSDAFTGPTREAFLANGKFAGDIHPFIAGLAEDHLPGSELGPLFHAILVDQFTRLRDGDRFFVLNQNWAPFEVKLGARGATLGEIIKANTNVTNLQADVFKFTASIGGTVFLAPRGPGVSGITVQLTDGLGNVLATTVTDSQGRYLFNADNGLASTGIYRVVLSLPPNLVQVKPNAEPISISTGGTIKRVNFGVKFVDVLSSSFAAE